MLENFKIGQIVYVKDDNSCFSDLLGSVGIITDVYDNKCMVLFKFKTKSWGSFKHSVLKEDLMRITLDDIYNS
ncbi:hypothetical protein UT300012_33180 [Paraclostridium bifermentans]